MRLKINEAKNLREDGMRPSDYEGADNTTRNVYTLSLCAHTNCDEGSKYYSRHDDHNLLSHAKDIPGINYDTMEISGLGYDDLSFTFEADSPATARKFAKRICAYAEPPCEECAMEYDDESTGSMVGPMTWEEFENADDFTDTLVTFEGLKKIKSRKSGKKLKESPGAPDWAIPRGASSRKKSTTKSGSRRPSGFGPSHDNDPYGWMADDIVKNSRKKKPGPPTEDGDLDESKKSRKLKESLSEDEWLDLRDAIDDEFGPGSVEEMIDDDDNVIGIDCIRGDADRELINFVRDYADKNGLSIRWSSRDQGWR